MDTWNKKGLIDLLSLTKHVEGGYYRETYISSDNIRTSREHNDGVRCLTNCIFYMLTDDSPIGYFHKNISPILHFYHGGSSLTYYFIYPDGKLEKHLLGPDVNNGHKLQLIAPGNIWKATKLNEGDFCLLSEVVSPGWEVHDSVIADYKDLILLYPEHMELLKKHTYNDRSN